MSRSALVLMLIFLLAGCGRPSLAPAEEVTPPEFVDVWAGLDDAFAGLAGRETEVCDAAFATWFADFGTRGLACAVAQVVTPTAFVARAPVAPFQRGPHTATANAVRLDLSAPRTFGHYDPAFVEWLIRESVPVASGPVRTLVQPVYDRRVRRLARVYWLTHADLASGGFPAVTPDGPLADYAAFLDGGPVPDGVYSHDGGFSVFAFTDRSERLLPRLGLPVDNDWTVKYEANTAYGFWLRRRTDGTLGLWHEGLRRLLQTYDAAWLAES